MATTYVIGTYGYDDLDALINYYEADGHARNAWLELPNLTGTTRYAQRNNYISQTPFAVTTPEVNAIRSAMANTKSTQMRFVVYDTVDGTSYYFDDYGQVGLTPGPYMFTVRNANPVFTTIAYHDSNSTTVALTGNDQYIIQNLSIVNADIASGNKAVAQKFATMGGYTASIPGLSQGIAYTTSTINQVVGTIASSTNQALSVLAWDSRNYTTTVQKIMNVVPYSPPSVNVTATRQDGLGTNTTISVIGTYSTITVAGVPKNVVNAASGVGYKVWEVGGVEPGSYTNMASTSTGGTTTITSAPVEVLDQTKEYNLKVQITDSLNTVVTSSVIGTGKSALRIGLDSFLYNNNNPLMPSHVGQIIMSTALSTAGAVQAIYAGTWAAFSAGTTLVGYSSGDPDFGTPGGTGGAKTHFHWQTNGADSGTGFSEINGAGSGHTSVVSVNRATYSNTGTSVNNTRRDGTYDSSNIMPYKTVYMWQRTA